MSISTEKDNRNCTHYLVSAGDSRRRNNKKTARSPCPGTDGNWEDRSE